MPITEIARLAISPGNEKIGDPSNKGAKVLSETAQTLLNTPGCQKVHMGTVIEDAQTVQLLIGWESLGKHRDFMASSRYAPFSSNIKTIVTAKPTIYHVEFDTQQEFDAALAAPVTELVAFYFDTAVSSDYGQDIGRAKKIFENAKGYRALAWGLTHETDVEHNGVKGQAAVLAIGWDSVEDHMALRETQLFKDNATLLRSTSKTAAGHHIQALRVHKD